MLFGQVAMAEARQENVGPGGNPQRGGFVLPQDFPTAVTVEAITALSSIIRGKRLPIGEIDKLISLGVAIPGSIFLLDACGENHDSWRALFREPLRPKGWALGPAGRE